MFETSNLMAFLLAGVALNLVPGADTLYIISRSVGQGKAAGVVSALGIAGGALFHTFAAAVGVSALLLSSSLAFAIVKYAGAAYLLYIGITMLMSKQDSQEPVLIERKSLYKIFGQGIVTNILNPKVALFFLAFLPQFVDPERGSVSLQLIILGLIFNTTGTIWNVLVALLSGSFGRLLQRKPQFRVLQKKITGGIFLVLATRLAISHE